MMDFIFFHENGQGYSETESYLEYSIKNSDKDLKRQVYKAMERLEGWCSREKASRLIDLILESKPKVVVEIGVFGGKSLVPMALALRYNKMGKIFGIDPWKESESIVGMNDVNKEWWGSINHEAIYEGLVSRIAELKLEEYSELIKATSEEAAPIPNIDILHIDGNHSEETSLFDVHKWAPLVSHGGYIIFDDVTWGTTDKAVQWLDENCVKIAEFGGDNVWGIWKKP